MDEDEDLYVGAALAVVVLLVVGLAAAFGPVFSDWILK